MALWCLAGRHDNSCNVFPKDLYIEEGSTAELFCQTSCEREKIFWTLDSKPIHENGSLVINSTLTAVSLKDFTLRSATLECHSSKTQQILGGTIISTYSKKSFSYFTFIIVDSCGEMAYSFFFFFAAKPRNISCIWYYKDVKSYGTPQLLTCRWEHRTNPLMNVNYSVLGYVLYCLHFV